MTDRGRDSSDCECKQWQIEVEIALFVCECNQWQI